MGAPSAHRPVHRPESSVGIASVRSRQGRPPGAQNAWRVVRTVSGQHTDRERRRRLASGLGRPPGSQRKTAVAPAGVQLDRQYLVKLNDIRLKAQP